jgi:hypothetical protein
VDASERINSTIQEFNISHGLNFLLADVTYRWIFADRGKDFLGRLQPYAGAGIGAARPHVELFAGGLHFEQYQWHGPAVEGFAGANLDLFKYLSLFVEYKFTYADLDRLNIPGGFIEVTPLTHHLVTGVSVHF